MSGSDLIVAAPWIAFGVGVLVLCIQLLRSRRAVTRPSARPRRAGEPSRRPPEDPGDDEPPGRRRHDART
jgi:hypothetical protein